MTLQPLLKNAFILRETRETTFADIKIVTMFIKKSIKKDSK